MRWLPLVLLAACSRPPPPVHIDWTVTGRVLDAQGRPLAGARVIAIPVEVDDEPPFQREGKRVEVPARADGSFAIDPGVDDDRTFLIVRRKGHAISDPVHMLDVAARGRTIDLRVGPAPARVTVVVRGEPGTIHWQTGQPGQGGRLPVTDEVTIEDMPPGEVRIAYESRSGHFEIRDLVAEPELKVHFQNETTFLTRGVVVDPDGKPVAGAYIHDFRNARRSAVSGEDGTFGLPGAPPEEHGSLEAIAPGYARTIVESGANVRIVLVPSIAFKGRVTDTAGRPIIRARVVMRSMDDPPLVTATIDHGHFFFDHGRPKEKGSTIFGIDVQAPGYRTHETDPLPIDEPGTVDLGVIELEKVE
ncbi:MAG: carboxypeptidase-like regulatory domain-containing protein [Planctomycetota bacterium]|jgi:hypothetical protein